MNSIKSFKLAITGIAFIVLFFFFSVSKIISTNETLGLLLGILLFIIIVSGISGFIYSLKSIKEPNTFKKVFGLVFNFLLVFLILALFISNGLDIYKAFN